jgi:hypothetical protein
MVFTDDLAPSADHQQHGAEVYPVRRQGDAAMSLCLLQEEWDADKRR